MSLKQKFLQLSIGEKVVLFGAFIGAISALMPWYNDIDRFKIGDSYLGITGPLYLTGVMMLVAFGASLFWVGMKLLGRNRRELPFRESYMHFAVAAFSVLMLVVAASVYFHPKFGINVTEKNMGLGMMLGFVSSLVLVIGGVLGMQKRERMSIDDVDPLAEIGFQNRERADAVINGDANVADSAPKEKPMRDAAYMAYQEVMQSKRQAQEASMRNTNDIS